MAIDDEPFPLVTPFYTPGSPPDDLAAHSTPQLEARIELRVHPEEKAMIEAAAERYGVSASEFIRRCVRVQLR